jgi:hypothetical protein
LARRGPARDVAARLGHDAIDPGDAIPPLSRSALNCPALGAAAAPTTQATVMLGLPPGLGYRNLGWSQRDCPEVITLCDKGTDPQQPRLSV